VSFHHSIIQSGSLRDAQTCYILTVSRQCVLPREKAPTTAGHLLPFVHINPLKICKTTSGNPKTARFRGLGLQVGKVPHHMPLEISLTTGDVCAVGTFQRIFLFNPLQGLLSRALNEASLKGSGLFSSRLCRLWRV
jgi:hypothetical protein